jgi:hypothetical protein
VRPLMSRAAACALCVTVALGAAAVPCDAADTTVAKAGVKDSKLTRLSPASRQLLLPATPAAPRAQQTPPADSPSSPGSFFKSTRGKVTLALMAAGTVFTIWSINHDRKPVRSPIR